MGASGNAQNGQEINSPEYALALGMYLDWKDGGLTPKKRYSSESITENTTWIGSPVSISGTVTVESGVTLTILPGTKILFEDGAKLTIKGQLIAEGKPSKRITFQSENASPPTGSWQGIKVSLAFNNTEDSSLVKYVTVKDAKYGIHGVYASTMTYR